MPTVLKNNLCFTFSILHFELANIWVVPERQIFPNFNLHHFVDLRVVDFYLIANKLLFNVPIAIPHQLIPCDLVVDGPVPSCNPELKPSC